MFIVVVALLVGLGLLALAGLPSFFIARWRRTYWFEPLVDEVHWAVAQDGWRLALRRRRGEKAPVVLCHGIASNSTYLDLDPRRSLAGYLQEEGWDVWSLDLRGCGLSRNAPGRPAPPVPFPFDIFPLQDVPAVIGTVLRHTGAPRVNWIGHSMGGMAVLAHLAIHPKAPIGRVIALASPLAFAFEPSASLTRLMSLYPLLAGLPVGELARLFAPLAGKIGKEMNRILFAPGDCLPITQSRLWFNSVETPSPGIVNQFRAWFLSQGAPSLDHAHDYFALLGQVRTPVLLVGGMADSLAPPQEIEVVYNALGSPQKELFLCGRSQGHVHDYGHMGLVLGDDAREEIFPRLAQWLAEREWKAE